MVSAFLSVFSRSFNHFTVKFEYLGLKIMENTRKIVNFLGFFNYLIRAQKITVGDLNYMEKLI